MSCGEKLAHFNCSRVVIDLYTPRLFIFCPVVVSHVRDILFDICGFEHCVRWSVYSYIAGRQSCNAGSTFVCKVGSVHAI